MTPIFRGHAPLYWAQRLCVVPVEPGEKRPAKEIRGWQGYCNEPPRADVQRQWRETFGHYGIGLLLNTSIVPDHRLVAIDVDDDAFVSVTKAILGESPTGKRGKKGATLFALARASDAVRSTTVTDPGKAPKIDILANGRMTVLPPSIHPSTSAPYGWLGLPLLDCPPERLPSFDQRNLICSSWSSGRSTPQH
jgi:hypothetical protein